MNPAVRGSVPSASWRPAGFVHVAVIMLESGDGVLLDSTALIAVSRKEHHPLPSGEDPGGSVRQPSRVYHHPSVGVLTAYDRLIIDCYN